MHRGSDCTSSLENLGVGKPSALIDSVVINSNPGHPAPPEGRLSEPNHADLLFALERSTTSRRFTISVKWKAELGMAPLEVHYNVGANPQPKLTRRIVVQLASTLTSSTGARKSEPVRASARKFPLLLT